MATLDRLSPPVSAPIAPAWTPRRAIAVALTLVAAIALIQVLQSSSIAHSAQGMRLLELRKSILQAEIHQLEADIAVLSSLDRIERSARDRLGMTPAENVTYLSVSVPASAGLLLPRPLSPVALDSETTGSDSESWWQALVRALPKP